MCHISAVLLQNPWLDDLEDISQGQRSVCATHLYMLVTIWAYYRKKQSRTVGVTEQTQHVGPTDGWTDRRTDGVKPIYPHQQLLVQEVIMTLLLIWVPLKNTGECDRRITHWYKPQTSKYLIMVWHQLSYKPLSWPDKALDHHKIDRIA